MAKAFLPTQTASGLTAVSSTVQEMDRENWFIQMGAHMRAILETTIAMAKEPTHGLLVGFMKETGKQEKCMVSGDTKIIEVSLSTDDGKKDST